MPTSRPTRQEIAAAVDRTLPHVLAPRLHVVFCGINPGLLSAAVGHHFARPGNRFWPTLHRAGFTPRQLSPAEQWDLLELGCGLTNVVERASATADALSRAELEAGGQILRDKVERYAPRYLAVLGIGAYRAAFGRPRAALGPQPETIG
ncbi:MAG TPA: G/U mismatch-specific DNA glycosylase, partial [Longimicrobiaceae bacterium]|nr:G/U mismatch-specific DNA glycosylase [Longimicrobiaceae bacterium]